MPQLDSFVIGPTPGYSPGIGRLVGMMTYARWTTLRAVEELTTAQLDHLHDSSSNSIGALLAHIASVEIAYQRITFAGRGISSPEHDAEWAAALQLGDRAREEIRGKPLEHYVSGLAAVRAFTLEELTHHDDRWLDQTTAFWSGRPANNYFKWFHVFEDELNHRGQIRWLRQRLP
ncbi:MAG TPA: DinB family protein [Gemmatimonadaceae bacterium]|nr:DinB family protein [Gemmatimonadaceae bacterium]